jgi:hypothetical protein
MRVMDVRRLRKQMTHTTNKNNYFRKQITVSITVGLPISHGRHGLWVPELRAPFLRGKIKNKQVKSYICFDVCSDWCSLFAPYGICLLHLHLRVSLPCVGSCATTVAQYNTKIVSANCTTGQQWHSTTLRSSVLTALRDKGQKWYSTTLRSSVLTTLRDKGQQWHSTTLRSSVLTALRDKGQKWYSTTLRSSVLTTLRDKGQKWYSTTLRSSVLTVLRDKGQQWHSTTLRSSVLTALRDKGQKWYSTTLRSSVLTALRDNSGTVQH